MKRTIREIDALAKWLRTVAREGAPRAELHRRGTTRPVASWPLESTSARAARSLARAICARADRVLQGERPVFCIVVATYRDEDGEHLPCLELRERRGGAPVGEPGEELRRGSLKSPEERLATARRRLLRMGREILSRLKETGWGRNGPTPSRKGR
jgi:hypothetical protein